MRDEKELRIALKSLLDEKYIEEGFNILMLCDDKWYNSFYEELKKDSGNTACLAIDFAKNQLVKDGKMQQNPEDGFGNMPFFD